MYIPKRYGQSKIDKCPFCQEQAITRNSQNVPVCNKHKESILNEMKCICGEHLDMMNGKFGLFFNCLNCGNMNPRKVFEMNIVKDMGKEQPKEKAIPHQSPKLYPEKKQPNPKEITIRSDDPMYFN